MGINYYLEAFKRATDFQGVSTRPEYWYFYLWNVIIAVTVMLIFGEESIPDLIYTLVTVIPTLSVGIRRLHDVGKSGWNFLWVFTIIGIFYILYLLMQPSEEDAPILDSTASQSMIEELKGKENEEDEENIDWDTPIEDIDDEEVDNSDEAEQDSDLAQDLKDFK
tara:strand:+ start:1938 stop:2432 length:495 start_codon:yes stop_codon:yes gene_type:complete